MAGPYTDEQIINFIIELRTRPNNPLTENEAIAAVQDTYGISDERISQIENLLFQQSSAFFNPIKFAATSEDPLIDTTTKKTVKCVLFQNSKIGPCGLFQNPKIKPCGLFQNPK